MIYQLNKYQEKWLSALESGDYAQCTKALHEEEGDTHCCLGVAVRVLEAPGFIDGGDLSRYPDVRRKLCLSPPPKDALEGVLGEGENTLIDMNDDDRLSFSEIAAAVRADPARFFDDEVTK